MPGQNSFYLRKEVDVPGYPVSARLVIRSESGNRVFFNGQLVDGTEAGKPVRLTSQLRMGKNVIGVECSSAREFSMEGGIMIDYIPREVLTNGE